MMRLRTAKFGFRQQQRAEHRADEGSPTAAQARPPEHDRGNARQRIVRALARIDDANLRHQHHRAKSREQRRHNVGGDESSIDPYANSPSGFLIATHRPKLPSRA